MRLICSSRPISEENSKQPYFRLAVYLCLWFSKRLDQSSELIDNINEDTKLLEIFAFFKHKFVLTKVNIQSLNIFINLLVNWTLCYICLLGSASSTQNQWLTGSKPKGEPLYLFYYYNYSFKIYLSLSLQWLVLKIFWKDIIIFYDIIICHFSLLIAKLWIIWRKKFRYSLKDTIISSVNSALL